MQQSDKNILILGIKCVDIVIVGFWTLGQGMFINHGGSSNNSTAVLCGP